MFKLISLALAQPIGTIIGLLTVISIAPNSEAMNANSQPISLQQPAGDLYSQIIFRNEDRRGYSRRERERREEIERQREAERRQYRRSRRRDREYYRREGEYYRRDGGYYRRDGEYRRNR
jgi:hypothetical protein